MSVLKGMSISAILIFLISNPSFAHKIGNLDWCLMYTSTHWECVYQNSNQCEDVLKAVKILAKKNPTRPLVAGEDNGKKIDPICEKNPSMNSGDL